jgi:hypothetical protein
MSCHSFYDKTIRSISNTVVFVDREQTNKQTNKQTDKQTMTVAAPQPERVYDDNNDMIARS